MIENLSMDFQIPGDISVAEMFLDQVEKISGDIAVPKVEKLVDAGLDDVFLTLSYDVVTPVGLHVAAHRGTDPGTDRCFSAVINGRLSWREIARLRDFLGLVLACKEKDAEEDLVWPDDYPPPPAPPAAGNGASEDHA
jgi:hypothetical protein